MIFSMVADITSRIAYINIFINNNYNFDHTLGMYGLFAMVFHEPVLLHIMAGLSRRSQKAKFMGTIWGPPGSCRSQMGPMLAPWTLLSGLFQGWWLLKLCLFISSLAEIFTEQKYWVYTFSHIHIFLVSPQLSCFDICQILTGFHTGNQCFHHSEKLEYNGTEKISLVTRKPVPLDDAAKVWIQLDNKGHFISVLCI